MSMNSMTGFGRGLSITSNFTCQIEIKTVNARYLDVNIKLPRQLYSVEDSVRRLLQEHLHRGKVDLMVTFKETGDREKEITVNRSLVGQLKAFLVEEKFYQSLEEVPLQALMSITDEWVRLEDIPLDEEEIRQSVEEATLEALDHLKMMRSKEGRFIAKDLLHRLSGIEQLISEIEMHKESAFQFYKERLYERIQDNLSHVQVDISMDRFMQEMAILSDKVDITEEIVRFASHVVQLKDILKEDGPVGRKLDFLLQEMNREANTMGSKGNHSSIIDRVVQLKVELEKIREQIQNVE